MTARRLRVVALAACLLTFVSPSSAESVESVESAEPADEAQVRHRIGAIIYIEEGDDWGDEVERGLRAAIAEASAAEIVIKRHSFDLVGEMKLIRGFIEEGIDAIVFPAVRGLSSVYMVKEAHEAGLEIVCFNTCVERSAAAKYVAAFFQSDQTELGYQNGMYLAQWIADRRDRIGAFEPKIAIVQCEFFEACYERGQGFRTALADAGVEWFEAASREALSIEAARDILLDIMKEQPEVNIIWGDNGQNTLGAVEAVRRAGREGEVFVFGTDMGERAARMLLDPDDVLQTASSMMTFEMARRSAATAIEVLEGNRPDHYLQIMPSPFFSRDHQEEIERFLLERRDDQPTSRGKP